VNKTVNHFMLSLIDIERSNDRAVSKPNWHFGTLYLLIIVSLWAYFAHNFARTICLYVFESVKSAGWKHR